MAEEVLIVIISSINASSSNTCGNIYSDEHHGW